MLSRDMNKPIVNQVTMIESKFQKQDSGFYGRKVHLPAAIFNKSPTRLMPGQLQSPNRLGTPSRLQGKMTSPIRFRKQMETSKANNFFSQPNPQMLGSGNSQLRSRGQPFLSTSGANCSNMSHGLKPGTFFVEINNSNSIFCEKCAILYASQGYKVERMEKQYFQNAPNLSNPPSYNRLQTLCQLQNPERRSELMTFLNEIQKISTNLTSLKGEAEIVLRSNSTHFKDQEQTIQIYFNQIKQMIDLQKNQLLQQVRILQQQANKTPNNQLNKIMMGISDCETMKDDIYESIEVIRQVDDQSFDKVILAYKNKARQIKSMNYLVEQSIELPRIVGEDIDDLSRKIVGLFNFRVETGEKREVQTEFNPVGQKHPSVYFSFDNQSAQQAFLTSNDPNFIAECQEISQQSNSRASLAQRLNSNMNDQYEQQ